MPLSLPHPSSRGRRVRAVVATLALALAGSAFVAAPAQATLHPRAVALGDSFASGEGLAPYRAGTDTATNTCHRSPRAYPELLDEGRHPAVRRIRSVACSGAVTTDVVADLTPDNGEPAQITALSRRTRTVTLTIGGNDVGFATVLGACVYTTDPRLQGVIPGRAGCSADPRLNSLVTTGTARLASREGPGSLAQVLVQVHRAAPKAEVYVTGYPRLFGLADLTEDGCQVGSAQGASLFVASADVRWIRSSSDRLNAALQTGVQQARSLGVPATYVDVADAFTGHNVCGSRRPWINGVVLSGLTVERASFHPNARGQQAYAAAVATAIRGHRPRS